MLHDHKIWVVSTEGDCEGRSVLNLGIFEGTPEEIGLHLADKMNYNLDFCEYKDPVIYKGPYKPKRESISIRIYANGQGNYPKNVIAYAKDKRAVKLANLEKKVVSQLTPDEKKLVAEALMRGEL